MHSYTCIYKILETWENIRSEKSTKKYVVYTHNLGFQMYNGRMNKIRQWNKTLSGLDQLWLGNLLDVQGPILENTFPFLMNCFVCQKLIDHIYDHILID